MPTHKGLLPWVFAALGCSGEADGPLDSALEASADTPAEISQDTGTTYVTLRVREVNWNPGNAMVGVVHALGEIDNGVVLFGDQGARVMVGGAQVSTDPALRMWRAAGAIPAAVAIEGTWLVGVDAMGRVHRLRALERMEPVSDRYGLGMASVRTVARVSETLAAFGIDGGFALADGRQVRRFADPFFQNLSAGGGRLGGFMGNQVRLFDVMANRMLMFEVPGALAVALNSRGQLAAATARSVYSQNPQGDLALRFEAPAGGPMVQSLVSSGERFWFAFGTELALLEGETVRVTQGLNLPANPRLAGASAGDVWSLSATILQRFRAPAMPEDEDELSFERSVRPVFVRTCSQCHLPNGNSHIDLSTYTAWDQRRPLVHDRVLLRRNMPPPGIGISEEDRLAVARWTALPVPDGGTDAGSDATVTDVRDVPMDTVRSDAPRGDVAVDTVRPDVRPDASDGGAANTFTAVYEVITRRCVSCHGASGGLNMSTRAMARTNLVGVAAAGTSCRGMGTRVVARSPMTSLLYLKISGAPPCGSAMPRGGAALTPTETETFRAWIAAGALDN